MQAFDTHPETVGRYQIVRLLGAGAMGRVYLAHDPVLDRDVAIKMIRGDLDISPAMRQVVLARMRHEARAAARVSHPNIVTLHDMSEDDALGICLVFEYVPGATLKDRILKGPLPGIDVARIARDIGQALSVAHKAEVLHRDVKPENIMLARYGAKIADFGIARIPDSTLTRTGGLLGTPAYSAPECISGGKFSPSSDQFSLAATLYEAIGGERAFPGDDAVTVASKIGTEEPSPIAQRLGLDPRVDQVLARGLCKDVDRRFETCEAFGEALAAALEIGTMWDATPTFWNPRSSPISLSKRPLAKWASVTIGSLAIGALGAVLLFSARPGDPGLNPEAELTPSASASPGTRPVPTRTHATSEHRARTKGDAPSSASASSERSREVPKEQAARPSNSALPSTDQDAQVVHQDAGVRDGSSSGVLDAADAR